MTCSSRTGRAPANLDTAVGGVFNCLLALNSPGTIDAGFRGDVDVILHNGGFVPYTINPGDRTAQLVFKRVPEVTLNKVDILPESQRGESGYGSTGA